MLIIMSCKLRYQQLIIVSCKSSDINSCVDKLRETGTHHMLACRIHPPSSRPRDGVVEGQVLHGDTVSLHRINSLSYSRLLVGLVQSRELSLVEIDMLMPFPFCFWSMHRKNIFWPSYAIKTEVTAFIALCLYGVSIIIIRDRECR